MPSLSSDRGVRAITLYKAIRGCLSLLAAVVLAGCALAGRTAGLHDFIEDLSAHWTTGVSHRVAKIVMSALEARHVWIVVGGLALDGALTVIEAYALARSYAWGPWLVVAATSLLLPFEAVSWWHHPTLGRALLFVANAGVAAYLARKALREHRGAGARVEVGDRSGT